MAAVVKSFADTLTEWRTRQRWTQAAAVEWLSGKLNFPVSLRTYQEWEIGRSEPHGIGRAAIENTIKEAA